MFTKGMRVRCNTDREPGRQFTAGKEYVVRLDSDSQKCFVQEDDSGRRNGWDGRFFDSILTIRAGRYYKTRDGRRVGLMKKECSEPHPWIEEFGDGRLWMHDGTGVKEAEGEDLIAEWVDEPVEAKFRVGDRVRVVSNGARDSYLDKYIGEEFVVTSLEGTDGTKVAGDGLPYWWPSTDLRLVAPATSGKPTIVALIENGQPKPSTYPFVHPDREAAAKEARRLAGKHKGKEFGVYELVDTAKEARVYEHEWQRLAVSGQKIAAIKEVRSATGFTLKGAKDAVEHWLELNAA